MSNTENTNLLMEVCGI